MLSCNQMSLNGSLLEQYKTRSYGKNYFPLIWHRVHRNHVQQFFIASGICLLSHCLAVMGGGIHARTQTQRFLWYDTDHLENDVSNSSYIIVCVSVAAGTWLLCQCSMSVHCNGNMFRELLHSRSDGTLHMQPQTGLFRHLGVRGYTKTHRQQDDFISLLFF